jgi:hypothetical protein
MTERYAAFAAFNSKEVSEALAAESQPVRDVAHGAGSILQVADGKISLEVFPTAGVARVTTDHARLEVHRVPAYAVDAQKHRVVFEQGADDDRTRLMIRDDGKVSFYPVMRAAEAVVTEQKPSVDTKPTVTPPVASEAATVPQTASGVVSAEATERELVTLQGRLGRDPNFSETEDGLAASFLFGVNTLGQKKADWFWVTAYGDSAHTLKQAYDSRDPKRHMGQGTPVTVMGMLVPPEGRSGTRQGTAKDFAATGVTRLQRPAAPYKPGELDRLLGA